MYFWANATWKWILKLLLGGLTAMNIRIQTGRTPEERLAAVAVEVVKRMQKNHGRLPDYADFAKEFKSYLLELDVKARLEENAVALRLELTKRRVDLENILQSISFSDEF